MVCNSIFYSMTYYVVGISSLRYVILYSILWHMILCYVYLVLVYYGMYSYILFYGILYSIPIAVSNAWSLLPITFCEFIECNQLKLKVQDLETKMHSNRIKIYAALIWSARLSPDLIYSYWQVPMALSIRLRYSSCTWEISGSFPGGENLSPFLVNGSHTASWKKGEL